MIQVLNDVLSWLLGSLNSVLGLVYANGAVTILGYILLSLPVLAVFFALFKYIFNSLTLK